MNAFEASAFALLVGYVPLGIVLLRERVLDGLVAVQLGGTLLTLILVCLAEGFHHGTYFNLPVVSAALTWISGLIFARFLGRGL